MNPKHIICIIRGTQVKVGESPKAISDVIYTWLPPMEALSLVTGQVLWFLENQLLMFYREVTGCFVCRIEFCSTYQCSNFNAGSVVELLRIIIGAVLYTGAVCSCSMYVSAIVIKNSATTVHVSACLLSLRPISKGGTQ